ncbi:PAS domain-containing sensor histidine kinase [Hymenobacter cavernae]|uniref:histidine kinase n=1 Tax=Hymenobacter cavernae TaxID=2044852 RepID=A0ABQ1U7W8_9BACT|nr:PAS domain-containing protein [Hymenobacter cavernae]GGF12224.1 hypothetical protein GCM10011383_24300 [Hymenobacter cavernae]
MSAPAALLPLFNVLPDACMLLTPDLRIVAASDAYLAATLTQRGRLIGQYLFDAFPDNPQAPDARATHNLRASLTQVLATGQPHEMARQHYDVPDPDRPGYFVERHWLPRNIPVLDEQGQITHVLHVAQDVTAQVNDAVQLRDSEAREQSALASAEVQRQLLHDVLHQAPVAIAYLEGPDYRITLANPTVCEIWARPQPQLIGVPLLQALPELQGQGIKELLDGVLYTSNPYTGTELPVQLLRYGKVDTIYFNFVYQPQRNRAGQTTGVLVVATDVTEQVRARQRVEAQERQTGALNEELAAMNEELAAANEEIRANNDELVLTQLDLQRLNQELESRVVRRTRDLHRAQQEAERQRQRLEQLFMQAPAAICILNGPELVFELVNPSYQQLFHGREMLGKPLLEALPEIADHNVYHTFRRVYETGITHKEQAMLIPLKRPEDGVLEDRYFNYVQQARYNEQGVIDGVLAFAFEVTEQVIARKASAATAYQLRLLTDALPVLIGYLDRERRYQFANEAYRAWFNQAPAALLGQPVREIVGEKAYAATQGYMERALRGERVDFEATMPYREGFVKYIRTSYVPDVQNGQVLGFYTLVNDITEQVQAREQVQRLNQELAAINEELAAINEELQASNEELIDANQQLRITNADLDNFVYAASHDLKQPVNNLGGLFEEVRRSVVFVEKAEEQMLVPLIEGTLRQLSTTIDDLAALGQAQQATSPPEPIVLEELTHEVLTVLEPQVRAVQAHITTDFSVQPTLTYARVHLRTILLNLVGNALKYADPTQPSRIHIAVRLTAGQPVLVVRDNGLGFDADRHRADLFQLFRRFHTTPAGTGVGLYLVNRIVQAHGGRIEVESREGEGALFRVTLGRA